MPKSPWHGGDSVICLEEHRAALSPLLRRGLRFVRRSAVRPGTDEMAVVFGAPPSSLAIVDLRTAQTKATTSIEPGGAGGALAWSPNADLLVSIQKHAARFYDPHLQLVRELTLEYACSAAWSPDGARVAIGSWSSGTVVAAEPKSTAAPAGR